MPIAITRTDDGEITTLHLDGRLEHEEAQELKAFVDAIVEEHRTQVTLDLARLDLIDSMGVAALVGLYKRVRAIGGTVTVTGLDGQPEQIFKLLRMDKVFHM